MTMNSYSRKIYLLTITGIVIILSSCNQKADGNAGLLVLLNQPPPCPAITVPAGTTVVKSVSVRYQGEWYYTYLLKLEYPPADASYAMWIPPKDGGIKPAVLMTNPYDGIRWNGDNPPSYVDVFGYNTYVESGIIFLANGFGVLHVYGRFYTGGDLQNEVDDMVAGLRFLKDSGLADASKIGIWGGSWGGFEALYGAANAPAGAVPAAGVAFYPPSDFAEQEYYFSTYVPAEVTDPDKRNYYIDFFDEYILRIHGTTGWETWTADALLAKLATPFLVIHDEWDTLVPVTQSQYLAANSGGVVKPVWFYQDTPADLNARPYSWSHGELRQYQLDTDPPPAFLYGFCNTLASAFMIDRLAGATQPVAVLYDVNAINDFIVYVKYYTCDNPRDTGWAADRLHDLTDPRVIMLEVNSMTAVTGADAVAQSFLSNGWGDAAYQSAATVESALEGGGLPACP